MSSAVRVSRWKTSLTALPYPKLQSIVKANGLRVVRRTGVGVWAPLHRFTKAQLALCDTLEALTRRSNVHLVSPVMVLPAEKV
jgi:hypothetical protein